MRSGVPPAAADPAGIAARPARVAGVVGVTLGGSRARGDADAASDVDLGVYYRDGLDVAALRRLAADLDPAATVSERGGWGKGGVRAAATLPGAPERFEARVAALGQQPAQLVGSLAAAAELVVETAQNGGQGTAGQSPDGSG